MDTFFYKPHAFCLRRCSTCGQGAGGPGRCVQESWEAAQFFTTPVDSKVVLVETLGSWPASEPAKMCGRLTETSLPGWLLVPGHSVIRLAG